MNEYEVTLTLTYTCTVQAESEEEARAEAEFSLNCADAVIDTCHITLLDVDIYATVADDELVE